MPLQGRMLEDAIQRARTGQGAEMETGFSTRRKVDIETSQAAAEYRPFRYLKEVGRQASASSSWRRTSSCSTTRDNAYAAARC